MMLVNLSTSFIVLCLCKTGLCAETRGRLFSKTGTYVTVGSKPDYTAVVDSEVLCAIKCHIDEQCATFEYNEGTKLCSMSAGLLSGDRYGPHLVCPAGYQSFVREKNALCLKYYGTQMTEIVATTTCNNDGARLVLIQHKSMLQFVGDILKDMSSWEIWVNGYDADDDGNYETSEGHPLPYVPPGSGMYDDSGFQCIRLKFPSPYTFNDLPCGTTTRYVLCELVV